MPGARFAQAPCAPPQGPSPFELVLQPQAGQKRAEAIDIGARKDLKSTFVVNPGDTLNWVLGPVPPRAPKPRAPRAPRA